MPFSEVFNALLITYVATEYSLASSKKGGFSVKGFLTSRPNQAFLAFVVVINVLDRAIGATAFAKTIFEQLLHAPKILLAAVLYMLVLYVDCLRHSPNMTVARFLGKVGIHFLKILPLYPFLAVLISCGFMFVITAFEHLRLPLDWLNWPIYYGTLYGPFSLVYFKVKEQIVEEESYFIPQTTPLPRDFFQKLESSDSIRDLRVAHYTKTG